MSEGYNIRVLHRHFGGVYTEAFNWDTQKAGAQEDVLKYAMNKFVSNPPKGYNSRPLQDGDRLELRELSSGEITLYELLDSYTAEEV